MRSTTTMAFGLAFAALAACAQDKAGTPQHAYDPASLPQTVAEAKEIIVRSRGKKYFADPPGNVRAEDYKALFGDTVLVVNTGRPGLGYEPLNLAGLIFIGADGRYAWCKMRSDGRTRTSDVHWAATKRARGPGLTPISTLRRTARLTSVAFHLSTTPPPAT